MATLYGIKNCDTVKKARKWLAEAGHEVTFHDFRADGLDSKRVTQWLKQLGTDALVNKRSTTWKQLNDDQKQQIQDQNHEKIVGLLIENPTLIKRPVLETENNVQVGFKAEDYEATFG